MLLKIDFKQDDVVFQEDGRIILKVKYFAEFAKGCHLGTTKGETVSDYHKNKALSLKAVFVGRRGGLSFE